MPAFPPDSSEFGDPGPPSAELGAALAILQQRQHAVIEQLLRYPEMVSSDDFGPRVNRTGRGLEEWRREGKVLALGSATRGYRYPDWQVGPDGGILETVVTVLSLFGQPLVAYRFMTTPLDLLGGRAPRDLLGSAEEGSIAELAEATLRGDFL